MDPKKIKALRWTMEQHRVNPRTQKALIEKVEDGLFDLEIKDDTAFLKLNSTKFELHDGGLVSID